MSDVATLKTKTRSGARSVQTYPHPAFDLSSAFIPPSMKELYRWCLFLYMTHSEIKPILKKKVAYVQTPLIYNGTPNSKKIWKSLLESNINIKRVSIEALLDMSVYGVAYQSIAYPFERFLICPSCKEKFPIKNLKWRYEGHMWMSQCPKCHHKGEFKSETVTVRNRSRIKIIRWRPMDMEVQSNPWTGYKRYIYRVPRYLIKKIEDPKRNRVLVETTPDELLESIKQNKNFGLDEDQIYVFEELGPSSEDDNFPIPPLLHVFKDSWLYQTLRRAQEAISVEHILPMTVLIPSAAPAGASPHMNYNLQTWAANMQDMVRTWRRDPNAIFTAPFPCTVENIRGDAKALNVFNDMEMVRQQIAGGLDVPIEFVIGNLQWCQHVHTGLILTSNGLQYLKEMIPESEGRTEISAEAPGHDNESGEAVLAHNVGEKKSLEISFETGIVLCPGEEHAFRRLNPKTLEPEWVRAADLQAGDRVAVRSGTDLWPEEAPTLPMSETSSGEKPVSTPAAMTDDVAAIMGAMTAEGSLTEKSHPSIGMDDQDVMDDLKTRFDRTFGYDVAYRDSVPAHRFGSGRQYRVDVYRNGAARFLGDLCGYGYAGDKSIPHLIRTSPKPLVAEYLRYMFEGDGGVSSDVRYGSKSKKLCEETQAVLLNFDIISHVYPPSGNVCWTLTIVGEEMVRFRKEIGFVSERKKRALDAAIIWWGVRSYDRPSIRQRLPFVKERLLAFRKEHMGPNGWIVDHEVPEMGQEWYSHSELAVLLSKDKSTVSNYIKRGLEVRRIVPGVGGRFAAMMFHRDDVRVFIETVGVRRRMRFPYPNWEMSRGQLRDMDLSYVIKKDPALAKTLVERVEDGLIWVEVQLVKDGPVVPMGDLTVAGTNSYLTNGVVVHNSGASVSLRVLENVFLNMIEDLTRFEQTFLIPRLQRFLRLPKIEITHQKFKMADDVQQKQLALSLRQTNTISDRTTIEQLDFDFDKEKENKRAEREQRLRDMYAEQIAQAKTQAEALIIQGRAQMQLQKEQMDQQAAAQAAASEQAMAQGAPMQGGQAPQEANPAAPASSFPGNNGGSGGPPLPPPSLLGLMAEHFMKNTPDHMKEHELMALQETNPQLSRAIQLRMKVIGNAKKAISAQPEQKPPRNPEKAGI